MTIRVNWVRAFAQLRAWPLGCSSEEIARMTPREAFELWRQLNEMREAMSGLGGSGEAKVVSPKKEEASEPVKSPGMPNAKKRGIKIINGISFEKYACWDPTPGELFEEAIGKNPDNNPFCVPRSVLKERWYSMVVEFGNKGMLVPLGVPQDNNDEAVRDFFDMSWGENSRIFNAIKSAVENESESDGRGALRGLAKAGDLKSYGLSEGQLEVAGTGFYDHLRECAKRILTTETEMGFDSNVTKEESELVEIVDTDENGEPLEVAVAVFADDTRMDFPKGCKFTPDNHIEDGKVKQVRLRARPPLRDGKLGTAFFVPRGCNKEFIRTAIKRLELGV